ncbi:hypothetical protein IV203_030258 [Nitzschia inconspicua]|uniref:Uncharacterized protein n=1 Tax=Nitzschia inconspicua TaxID=303405 RepID=A0A9K3Q144_9STRA|nr:hypothetical protein IV203_030258 [Nitzschia inconspicua]
MAEEKSKPLLTTQTVTATSSTEPEFIAAVSAAKTAKYLRAVLHELSFTQLSPTPIPIDNVSAIQIINARKPTERSRHIEIQAFAIQDWKDNGDILMHHIPGVINPSDSLTKLICWQSKMPTNHATSSSSSQASPSFTTFFGRVIETVYRCDSAAVIASAYHCGSLTREALYQGVEVVYKCDGDGFRTAAGDFYAHQCYCGEEENHQEEFQAKNFTSPHQSLEGRNDAEEGTHQERASSGQRMTTEAADFQRVILETLTFEDSILNGPNSINELSSTASSLLDSTSSEPRQNCNIGGDRPATPTANVFCF